MKVNFTFWKKNVLAILLLMLSASIPAGLIGQSVARQWSEVYLSSTRKAQARPTVVARNACHMGVLMYDAWAVYDPAGAQTVLLGKTWGNYTSNFNGVPIPTDVQAAQEEAISYAMYRYILARFADAPAANIPVIQGYCNAQMATLGYNTAITSTDYSDGDPAKLGNYLAAEMLAFSLQDGSNQQNGYANQYYQSVNGNIWPQALGDTLQYNPNRWQPLSLTYTINDQTGFPIPQGAPALSAEWGNVTPFSLSYDDMQTFTRDGHHWNVYHDPGPPPMLDTTVASGLEDIFKWGYVLDTYWSSLHDTEDGVMIDISPASMGNVLELPETYADYPAFYDMYNGGDPGLGYSVNPATGLPYEPQMVKRSDYTRCLSEYWADGPSSETPPGHWIKIVNTVNDHPMLEKRWEGTGPILDDLQWDVRCYLTMGGALHDAAVACWSAKGFYDYTRPIMAIRYMADHGQASDPMLPNYNPAGFPLIPGHIELVEAGDPLAGVNDEFVGEVKLWAWLSPPTDPLTQISGVGWILAKKWWTYQKSNFVTPPFPGFYSGHSTFSRTAAEVLTRITGDEYFPGGMSSFSATQNSFLAAEDGPSTDIVMQWAKYQDAADQCSLSRIYGGLHPPQDDITGRKVGAVIGPEAFEFANNLILASVPHVASIVLSDDLITDADAGNDFTVTTTFTGAMNTAVNPTLEFPFDNALAASLSFVSGTWTDAMTYTATYTVLDGNEVLSNVKVRVSNAAGSNASIQLPAISDVVMIDTANPSATLATSTDVLADADAGSSYELTFTFDQEMDVAQSPEISFSDANAAASLTLNSGEWSGDGMTYTATYDVVDANVTAMEVGIMAINAQDLNGNTQTELNETSQLSIDTENPSVAAASISSLISDVDAGASGFMFDLTFDEEMMATAPEISFSEDVASSLTWNAASGWDADHMVYTAIYDVDDAGVEVSDIAINAISARDMHNNLQVAFDQLTAFSIDTKNPSVTTVELLDDMITDSDAGSSLTVTFNFDENMDADTAPSITFSSDLSGSLAYTSGMWMGNSFMAEFDVMDNGVELSGVDITATGATDAAGNAQVSDTQSGVLDIDTKNPSVSEQSLNTDMLADDDAGADNFMVMLTFDEPMDMTVNPVITFSEDVSGSLEYNAASTWNDATTFTAQYAVTDDGVEIWNIGIDAVTATDAAGNTQQNLSWSEAFSIDTKNPELLLLSANTYNVTTAYSGVNGFSLTSVYNEPMNTAVAPSVTFPMESPTALTLNSSSSDWINPTTFTTNYNVSNTLTSLADIDVAVANTKDAAGNLVTSMDMDDFFSINIIVSVNELDAAHDVLIYPNPAVSGKDIYMEWKNMPTGLNVDMYNASGALVMKKGAASASQNRILLETAGLSAGMYFIHVNSDQGRAVFTVNVVK